MSYWASSMTVEFLYLSLLKAVFFLKDNSVCLYWKSSVKVFAGKDKWKEFLKKLFSVAETEILVKVGVAQELGDIKLLEKGAYELFRKCPLSIIFALMLSSETRLIFGIAWLLWLKSANLSSFSFAFQSVTLCFHQHSDCFPNQKFSKI